MSPPQLAEGCLALTLAPSQQPACARASPGGCASVPCLPGARQGLGAEQRDLSSPLLRQVLPGTRMDSGSQPEPEREAACPDDAPSADSLQSPAFKRPATPPGSRSTQMSGGFTLRQGRLIVHDEEDTPKRMRLDRTHLEDGRRSSPGFSFRVGPSSDAAGLRPGPSTSLALHLRCGAVARRCGGGAAVRCGGSDNFLLTSHRTRRVSGRPASVSGGVDGDARSALVLPPPAPR